MVLNHKMRQRRTAKCILLVSLLLISQECQAFPLHWQSSRQIHPNKIYHVNNNNYYYNSIMYFNQRNLHKFKASVENQQQVVNEGNLGKKEKAHEKKFQMADIDVISDSSLDTLTTNNEELIPSLAINSDTKGTYDTSSSFNLPYSNEIKKILRNPLVEIFFCLLVLLSSFLVAVGTLPNNGSIMPEYAFELVDNFENAIVALFTVEFFARWYGLGQFTGRYLRKPLVIIDMFVVVLPFMLRMAPGIAMMLPQFLSSDSGLITLTLLRILRVQRILKDLDTFSEIEMVLGLERSEIRPYQLAVARVILSIFTLLTVASGMIYTAEHSVNPAIPDYFTALYFGLTTLTTVGFGDITPITFPGKVVVCSSILFGVTVIPAQAAALVDALLEYQQERTKKADEEADMNEIILIDYDDTDTIVAVDQKVKKSTGELFNQCPACNISSHRADASYCWSCGADLRVRPK